MCLKDLSMVTTMGVPYTFTSYPCNSYLVVGGKTIKYTKKDLILCKDDMPKLIWILLKKKLRRGGFKDNPVYNSFYAVAYLSSLNIFMLLITDCLSFPVPIVIVINQSIK